MRIEILDEAQQDLLEGFHFYEKVTTGLGSYFLDWSYFLDCLFSDIDSLIIYAGIHPIVWGYHRSLSRRFPFAIYYGVQTDVVRIHAVLDCRRKPNLD